MMTFDRVIQILTALGIPYAYYQFKEKPTGPAYIAYFETGKSRVLADDKVYVHTPQFAIELYTKKKDLTLEDQLIALFEQHEIVWSGGESVYIDSEKMYQTVFYC